MNEERPIKAISVKSKTDPIEIIFDLSGTKRESHKLEPENREQFMKWWKQAASFLQIQWANIEPIKKKPSAAKKKPSAAKKKPSAAKKKPSAAKKKPSAAKKKPSAAKKKPSVMVEKKSKK